MNRLETLASLCQGSSIVCDIGCDHAYALIMAIEEYGVQRGIASDISEGPLASAKQHILESHLEEQITTILSDGFQQIDFSTFDTVLISGMGGLLIIDILKPFLHQLRTKKMILGANSDVPLLRSFLMAEGFSIEHEVALTDKGKYYEILVVQNGKGTYDELDIIYGPILRRHPNNDFLAHWKKRQNLLDELISKLDHQKGEQFRMEKQEMNSVLKYPYMEKHFILNTANYYCCYFIHQQQAPTIILCPGGGYQYTSPRESEPVVDQFSKMGYHVIVVHYRQTPEDAYPLPGQYLATAINEVSKDARVGKLIGLGFSAGGHCLLDVILHADAYHLKPSFHCLMLGYPVITSNPLYAHQGSFERLLKERKEDPVLLEKLSLEKEVTKDNALPLFLWGTVTDQSVPVMNSYLLLEAYQKVGGNVEYHLFPFGGHGLSVANASSSGGDVTKESPYIARWVDLAREWLTYQLK